MTKSKLLSTDSDIQKFILKMRPTKKNEMLSMLVVTILKNS